MAVALSNAGKVVAHAYAGGAGNKTLASAKTASPQRSTQGGGFWSGVLNNAVPQQWQHDAGSIVHGVETGASAVKNAASGTAGAITHPGLESWLNNPAVNLVTGGVPRFVDNLAHPLQTAQALPGAIERIAAGTALSNLYPGLGTFVGGSMMTPWRGATTEVGNAAQGVWHGFGFGGGDGKKAPTVAKDPPLITLGKGTNTGMGPTDGGPGGTQAPGAGAAGAVMQGLGSGAQVPQPTYATVPQVGVDTIKPYNINPYFAYTDPHAFDIPGEAVPMIDPNTIPTVSVPPITSVLPVNPSMIDLNNIPQVNPPQMSASDQTAAGNLLSTGLNLQNVDWAGLMKGAGSIAAAQYGPQVQSLIDQAKNSVNTIQGYTSGAQEALQGAIRDTAQGYQGAIATQTALDQGIHNMLASSNPTAAETPQMNAMGFDPTTQAQIAAQNAQSFDTTGSVLGSIGQLNAGSLNAQSQLVQNYMRSLPSQIKIGGQQALSNVATGLTSSLATIATQQAKDAWQMAKDMGASDQKAGTAYQNAYNTTMNNWYKQTGQSITAQKANATNALGAVTTNVKNDLTGQTVNAKNDLTAQTANQKIDFGSQVANQRTGVDVAKANQSTGMKWLTANQSSESRIASINETTAAGIEKLNASNNTRDAIATQAADLSAGKANQNATVQTNYHNAQIYMEGVKQATSEENARTARGRLALALYKAENPTATATQSATASKAARDFFAKAAAYTPMGYKNVPVYNKNTGTTSTVRQPTYSQMTYGQMIDNYAQSNGGTPQAVAFATNMANSYVNPGYRGRPLDPGMATALNNANLPSTFEFTKQNVPYLTAAQGQYLNDNGFASFVQYMQQGVISHDDGSKERVFVMPPLKGGG